jgi:hypothetical protein
MEKDSKQKQVRSALMRGDRLSGLDILKYYGAYRASSIINRLRNAGLNIKTDMVDDGNNRYAVYYIPKTDDK